MSVINSHIIPIYGQHDYSQGFCFPLITKKKNTWSSLEIRQLLFSFYATAVCHGAVLRLTAKAFTVTYKQLAMPVHPVNWTRQSGRLLRSLPQVTGFRRPSWKPSQQLADSQLRRRKTKVDLNNRSIERRLSLAGVAKVHQVDRVCPDHHKERSTQNCKFTEDITRSSCELINLIVALSPGSVVSQWLDTMVDKLYLTCNCCYVDWEL